MASIESAKSIELKFPEASKAKSPSKVASFPSVLFNYCINNHNIAIFISSLLL